MKFYLNEEKNLINISNISIQETDNGLYFITILGHLLFPEEDLKNLNKIIGYLDSIILFEIIPYKKQYITTPEEKIIFIGRSHNKND